MLDHNGDTRETARRALEICNSCRYCDGYCAMFLSMERRRAFSDGDLTHLANLCHNCRNCYYACQYAPPHPFAVNVPASLARVRWQSYEEHAWPSALRGLFRSNGRTIAWLSLFIVGLTVALTVGIVPAEALFRPHHGPGAFYAVIPWGAMAGLAGTTLGWSVLALAMGARSFWRATGGGTPRALGRAFGDALALRNLGGGGIGCAEGENGFSPWRRRFHHALFYGIGLCAAATAVATVYDHVFGWEAPYSRFSVPVVLGSLGGLGMVIGAIGLLHLKDRADRAPTAVELQGADRAFLHLLWLTATSGLALMALRGTAAMGLLLAVHLGTVLAVFVALPYSRFVHSVYRVSALVRAAMEGGRVER